MRKLIPSLGVTDMERSVEFYGRYFDFEIVNSYEEEDRLVWCQLKSGQADLMLQQMSQDQLAGVKGGSRSWVIYISPEDIETTYQRLVGDGVEVGELEETTYGTCEFFVDDLDKYELWVSAPRQ